MLTNANAINGLEMLDLGSGTQYMHFYAFDSDSAAVDGILWTQTSDRVLFCGKGANKGVCSMHVTTIAGNDDGIVADAIAAADTGAFGGTQTNSGNTVANGILSINAPSNGFGQFKALDQDATADKYVVMNCKGIAPMYMATFATAFAAGSDNGFIIQCYTGAPQCIVDVADYFTMLSATDVAACMNDPRYLTWRVMTMKIDYTTANMDWYRVDSYWNATSTEFASTMGTTIILSTSKYLALDNYALANSTNHGKTFVFAYGDGSGVQFNHIGYGWSAPNTNNSLGNSGNTIVTAPASYTNTYPNRLSDNLCLTSYLFLSGTTDTSELSTVITTWSDGY